jgi:hypothetical protein
MSHLLRLGTDQTLMLGHASVQSAIKHSSKIVTDSLCNMFSLDSQV